MFKSVVKVCGSTVKLQWILDILSAVEAGGIRGVAVKCLDVYKRQVRKAPPCLFSGRGRSGNPHRYLCLGIGTGNRTGRSEGLP